MKLNNNYQMKMQQSRLERKKISRLNDFVDMSGVNVLSAIHPNRAKNI